jgi:hypothetical protein
VSRPRPGAQQSFQSARPSLYRNRCSLWSVYTNGDFQCRMPLSHPTLKITVHVNRPLAARANPIIVSYNAIAVKIYNATYRVQYLSKLDDNHNRDLILIIQMSCSYVLYEIRIQCNPKMCINSAYMFLISYFWTLI